MNKKLSRRDFLKLASATSAGFALSACGVKPTELPTLTPTNTSIPTEMAKPFTLRALGEKLGIIIGESPAGDNPYNDAAYRKALGEHFSILWPAGYLQSAMDLWGTDIARQFRQSTIANGQILIVGPVFWNADIPYTLKNATKDNVIRYMQKRVNAILEYVPKTNNDTQPTYIMFMNEGLWVDPRTGSEEWTKARYNWVDVEEGSSEKWKAGPEEWSENPYYRVFGDDLIVEIYLMIYRAAEEKGLILGKDYRMLYNDFNNHMTGFGTKTDFIRRVLGYSRKKIGAVLGISEFNVQLDVGIEGNFFLDHRPWHILRPPTKAELTDVITLYKEQVGKVHITELNIIGAKNQAEITDTLGMLLQVAVKTECDSVSFWNALRCKTPISEQGDIYQVPQGLFDCDYKPTKDYEVLLQSLQRII